MRAPVADLYSWVTNIIVLPRERIQAGLVFLGLFCVGFGIALVQPGTNEEKITSQPEQHRVGFWKDVGISVAAGRIIGPWMIGSGAAAFVAAYLIRER